jgi:hypothetical protein
VGTILTHTRLISIKFVVQLTEEARLYEFGQDSATAHTAYDSLAAVEGVFGERIMA